MQESGLVAGFSIALFLTLSNSGVAQDAGKLDPATAERLHGKERPYSPYRSPGG